MVLFSVGVNKAQGDHGGTPKRTLSFTRITGFLVPLPFHPLISRLINLGQMGQRVGELLYWTKIKTFKYQQFIWSRLHQVVTCSPQPPVLSLSLTTMCFTKIPCVYVPGLHCCLKKACMWAACLSNPWIPWTLAQIMTIIFLGVRCYLCNGRKAPGVYWGNRGQGSMWMSHLEGWVLSGAVVESRGGSYLEGLLLPCVFPYAFSIGRMPPITPKGLQAGDPRPASPASALALGHSKLVVPFLWAPHSWALNCPPTIQCTGLISSPKKVWIVSYISPCSLVEPGIVLGAE